ncbi:hypothetical protein QVD99_002018 [Batrachochytrium dendrobatidis]|nr:hypothetical protein O5D80_000660 [Batrachochytrium dendrobatidis]KAK5672217.1 hypothetical protein QVD99_002018 [Batrachochytrium dendrobatidis]
MAQIVPCMTPVWQERQDNTDESDSTSQIPRVLPASITDFIESHQKEQSHTPSGIHDNDSDRVSIESYILMDRETRESDSESDSDSCSSLQRPTSIFNLSIAGSLALNSVSLKSIFNPSQILAGEDIEPAIASIAAIIEKRVSLAEIYKEDAETNLPDHLKSIHTMPRVKSGGVVSRPASILSLPKVVAVELSHPPIQGQSIHTQQNLKEIQTALDLYSTRVNHEKETFSNTSSTDEFDRIMNKMDREDLYDQQRCVLHSPEIRKSQEKVDVHESQDLPVPIESDQIGSSENFRSVRIKNLPSQDIYPSSRRRSMSLDSSKWNVLKMVSASHAYGDHHALPHSKGGILKKLFHHKQDSSEDLQSTELGSSSNRQDQELPSKSKHDKFLMMDTGNDKALDRDSNGSYHTPNHPHPRELHYRVDVYGQKMDSQGKQSPNNHAREYMSYNEAANLQSGIESLPSFTSPVQTPLETHLASSSRHHDSIFNKLFHILHHRRGDADDDSDEEGSTASGDRHREKESDGIFGWGGGKSILKLTSPELKPTLSPHPVPEFESIDVLAERSNHHEHFHGFNGQNDHFSSGSLRSSSGALGVLSARISSVNHTPPLYRPPPISTHYPTSSGVSPVHGSRDIYTSPEIEISPAHGETASRAPLPNHDALSTPSPFGFMKPKHDRRTRERSETEGSYSIFRELRTTINHRKGGSHQMGIRGIDDHDTLALNNARSSSKHVYRSGSEMSLIEKYGKPDEVLGKGANATVRLLTHRKDGVANKLYAIKEFRKKRKEETEKEYIKKVISEFCISSSMHHVNVMETIDLIRDEHNRWCEVMEYCAGGDLFNKIMHIGFSGDEEIHCLFRQLLEGVGYMHSVGVAHRDLKPENLLLDNAGQTLKITDFGTSAVFRTQWEKEPHKLHGVCGSQPYIAPEEWDTQHEYFPTKVDVWACGMILYAMLSKNLLWKIAQVSNEHYAMYLKKRETGVPQFLKYPSGPCQILYKCIDPDPVKRPEIAQLIEDHWISSIDCCQLAHKGAKGTTHTHLQPSK